jgi:hypothetical protein
MNPKLDTALSAGWRAWETVASELGAAKVAAWIAQRAGDDVPRQALLEHVEALFTASDDDERAVSRAELAELLEEADDGLADALWEGVLEHGTANGDAEVVFEATNHLAGIAEAYGDPLAAAEYYIDFLNWRRMPDNVSDAESVQTAFDEVVRLAEADGEPKIAALFAFRQVGFTKLADVEDDRATAGDWEPDPSPYASWS